MFMIYFVNQNAFYNILDDMKMLCHNPEKTIKQGEAAIASNLLSLQGLVLSDRMHGPHRKITVNNKEQAR